MEKAVSWAPRSQRQGISGSSLPPASRGHGGVVWVPLQGPLPSRASDRRAATGLLTSAAAGPRWQQELAWFLSELNLVLFLGKGGVVGG